MTNLLDAEFYITEYSVHKLPNLEPDQIKESITASLSTCSISTLKVRWNMVDSERTESNFMHPGHVTHSSR